MEHQVKVPQQFAHENPHVDPGFHIIKIRWIFHGRNVGFREGSCWGGGVGGKQGE